MAVPGTFRCSSHYFLTKQLAEEFSSPYVGSVSRTRSQLLKCMWQEWAIGPGLPSILLLVLRVMGTIDSQDRYKGHYQNYFNSMRYKEAPNFIVL